MGHPTMERERRAEAKKYTDDQVAEHKKIIDGMDHFQMAKLRRFAPPGHIYFDWRGPFYLYFENRFQTLGGMTPEISKKVGLRNA